MFVYWDNLRGNRPCPSRADVDPLDIPALLEYVSLADVRSTEPHFVYRLLGTTVVRLLGKDLTGAAVGTGVKASEFDHVMQRYETVASGIQPLYHGNVLQEETNDFTKVERLMLPLSDDRKSANMILSLVYPSERYPYCRH